MRGKRARTLAGLKKNREFDLLPFGSADTRESPGHSEVLGTSVSDNATCTKPLRGSKNGPSFFVRTIAGLAIRR